MARKIKPLTEEEKRQCEFIFSLGGKVISIGDGPQDKNSVYYRYSKLHGDGSEFLR